MIPAWVDRERDPFEPRSFDARAGMKDPAFARHLPRWRSLFTDAEVVALPDRPS